MTRILSYIFSAAFLLLFLSTSGQEKEEGKFRFKDLKLSGIKIGVDVGKFADYVLKPERTSYAGSVEIIFNDLYYGVIEGGYSLMEFEKSNYNYNNTGWFGLVGVDKNLLKKNMTDLLGVGVRVGYASFEHQYSSIIIEDPFWGIYEPGDLEEALYSVWAEGVISLEGEVLKNIYLGWTIRVKLKLMDNFSNVAVPYEIPGFGKAEESIRLGFSYSVYYKF